MTLTLPANYYNRFDAAKKYKQLLFRAGRGLQSSEMNELHSVLQNELRQVGNTLFSDGSILRGGKLVPGANNTFSIASSLFWALGYTHNLDAYAFSIDPSENCVLGVAVSQTVINEDLDPALRDPAVNTRNFNEPGAHRLKITARWTKAPAQDGEYFYGIFEFQDGVQITTPAPAPNVDGVKDIIARYDMAANGSYVVNGLLPSFVSDDNDLQQHILQISAGIGHVDGYEMVLPYARRVRVDMALDTRSIGNEPITIVNGQTDYKLRWGPIASVGEVNGIATAVKTTALNNAVTRNIGGSSAPTDLLTPAPVTAILAVNQGGTWNGTAFVGGTNYTVGTDYILNGDRIDWSLAGNEPAAGSTYQIVYNYQLTLPTAVISADRTKVTLTGFTSGQIVNVDYAHYIPRYDVITLTRDNNLVAVKGVADYQAPKIPQPSSGLGLATIYVSYGVSPNILNSAVPAYRMVDNANMARQIADLQYNVARLALLDTLRSTDPATTKRGVFVDPLTDDTYRDSGVTQNGITSPTGLRPGVLWTSKVINNSAGGVNSAITLPLDAEVNVITQDYATKSRVVNQFAVVSPPPAQVTLVPDSYRWVTSTSNPWVWIASNSWDFATNNWAHLDSNRTAAQWAIATQGWTADNGAIAFDRNEIVDQLGTTPVVMPQINLQVLASKFNAGEQVDIYFDEVVVKSVNADGNGAVNTTFITPTWATSGTKLVHVWGKTSGIVGDATFNSVDINRTVTTYYWDPLAETMTFDVDSNLTSVDLAFASNTNSVVDVLVAQAQLGIPDRTKVLAVKRLRAPNISPNASGVTWTHVAFDQPIPLAAGQEYAVVLATDDINVSVKTAEQGAYDPVKGRWVSSQAYVTGVLLESANLSSWAPIPKEDLTFKVQKANFNVGPRTANFQTISVVNATDLYLLARVETPPSTTVKFVCTLLTGARSGETITLEPALVSYINSYTGDLRVVAVMTTSNQNVTPRIYGDITLAVGTMQTSSTYVNRAVPVPSSATALSVYLEIFEPVAGTISVQYRNPGDTAWTNLTRQAGTMTPIGDGFFDLAFTGAITGFTGANTNTRFRVIYNNSDSLNRPASRKLRAYFS